MVTGGLFLTGLLPGDAWLFPALDVYRKNGAPGGRSVLWWWDAVARACRRVDFLIGVPEL